MTKLCILFVATKDMFCLVCCNKNIRVAAPAKDSKWPSRKFSSLAMLRFTQDISISIYLSQYIYIRLIIISPQQIQKRPGHQLPSGLVFSFFWALSLPKDKERVPFPESFRWPPWCDDVKGWILCETIVLSWCDDVAGWIPCETIILSWCDDIAEWIPCENIVLSWCDDVVEWIPSETIVLSWCDDVVGWIPCETIILSWCDDVVGWIPCETIVLSWCDDIVGWIPCETIVLSIGGLSTWDGTRLWDNMLFLSICVKGESPKWDALLVELNCLLLLVCSLLLFLLPWGWNGTWTLCCEDNHAESVSSPCADNSSASWLAFLALSSSTPAPSPPTPPLPPPPAMLFSSSLAELLSPAFLWLVLAQIVLLWLSGKTETVSASSSAFSPAPEDSWVPRLLCWVVALLLA